jgi:hypothetical protein
LDKKQKSKPDSTPAPAPAVGVPKEPLLIYVDVKTDKPSYGAQATILASYRFVVTNVRDQAVYDMVTQSVFSVDNPDGLKVFIKADGTGQWESPSDAQALTSAVLQEARSFGITNTNIDDAYSEVRKKYEQEEVALPGVGLTVKSASFVMYASYKAPGVFLRSSQQSMIMPVGETTDSFQRGARLRRTGSYARV